MGQNDRDKTAISQEEYNGLLEKVDLPLPIFLQYVLKRYPGYSKNAWYDFYMKNRARKLGVALSLQCELTPRCNLNCKMCYVHTDKEHEKKQPELSTEQWLDILQQAVAEGIYSVCLSGGEAMMHSGFWEIYEYLHRSGVRVSVFTNGLCLIKEAVEHFQQFPPKIMQISLYGSCEEAYEKVTGSPVFTQIEQNLTRLKQAGLPFQIAITPSKFLYPDFANILQYVKEKGYPYRVNKTLFQPNEETGRKLSDICLSDEELGNIWKIMQKERDVDLPERDSAVIPQMNELSYRGVPCASGMTAAYINYQGIMNGCVALPIANANVCELGFKEAWKLVHNKSIEYCMPKECIECSKYSICCSHCPGEHFMAAGEGKCNIDICKRTDFYLEYQLIPGAKCNE